mgnify:FL=1
MARTAAYTVAEAEAEIGPRGSLGTGGTPITSENRNLVRQWLVAKGMASAEARTLTLSVLNQCYNGLAHMSGEDRFRELLDQTPEPAPFSDDPEPAPKQTKETATATPETPDVGATVASAVNQALAGLLSNAGVSESRVVELVKQHAPQAPAISIDLTKPSGKTVTLPAGTAHKDLKVALSIVTEQVPLMLIGPAGSGKTTLASQIADALELDFYFTGAVDSPYRLLGFRDGAGNVHRTAFRDAFEKGGVFLFDEQDASMANAILSFNAAVDNRMCDFPDGVVKAHPDFRVIASANTWGHGADRMYVGRMQQDGASLNRYFQMAMDYDEDLERAIAGNDEWVDRVQAVRKAVRSLKLRHIVSPRQSIHGAKLLAAGIPKGTVEAGTIFAGLDSDTIRKVKAAL